MGGWCFIVKKVKKKLKKSKKKGKNKVNFAFLGWVGGVLVEKKVKKGQKKTSYVITLLIKTKLIKSNHRFFYLIFSTGTSLLFLEECYCWLI